MQRTQWLAVLVAQLSALALTMILIQTGLSAQLDEDLVKTYSGTLTLLLILLGFGSQVRAKTADLPLAWILGLAAIAPAFAYLSGPIVAGTEHARYLISYHVIGATIQLFVLYKEYLRAKVRNSEQAQRAEKRE